MPKSPSLLNNESSPKAYGKNLERHLPLLGRIFAIVFSVGITAAIIIFRHQLHHFARYGYLGIFAFSVIGNATIIIPAPTYAIAFAAGSVFNPIIVGIVAGLGASIGELTGYLAGIGGRIVFEERRRYKKLVALMRRYGALVIFILAAVPNPLFDIGGMTAGALKMPAWQFLLAAWVGKSIRFTIIAFSGAALFANG